MKCFFFCFHGLGFCQDTNLPVIGSSNCVYTATPFKGEMMLLGSEKLIKSDVEEAAWRNKKMALNRSEN